MVRRVVVLLGLILATAPLARAEKPEPPAKPREQFQKVFAEWKGVIAQLRQLQEEYQGAPPGRKAAIEADYVQTLEKGRKMIPRLAAAAEQAYAAAPNQEKEVGDFLATKLADDLQSENYEDANRVARLLVDHGYKREKLDAQAGLAAFATGDFARARTHWTRAAEQGELDEHSKRFLASIDEYERDWEKEQAIRAAEAKADDLPRVKLTTNKGDIVVELFENQAPLATANFINLVEQGYYNGLKFHRVIPGFMAQGGDNNAGGPGYNIPGEVDRKDHRLFYRGSLGVAITAAGPDSGDAQFFLTFLPTPHLNHGYTVFGRVVGGLDVLAKIERTETPQGQPRRALSPDTILKASVLRKRDHPYETKKLPKS